MGFMKYRINQRKKDRRFKLTKFGDEYIVSYFSKNKNLTKVIKKPTFLIKKPFPHFNKVVILTSIIAVFVFIFFMHGSVKDENIVDENEQLKNKIFLSAETDYSSPDKNKKVVIREHVVQKGDTLSELAKKYGVSMGTICGSSGLTSYDLIHVGDKLKIPDRDGILYKVKKGTDLISIAKKYKVNLNKIIAFNKIKNPDFLNCNATLFIPDARPQNIVSGFLWPTTTRRITCGYGWRRNPFNYHVRQFHPGLDIGVSYKWVRASKYGKVTYAGWLGGYGKAVIIAHPGGWKTLYGHLSRIIVRTGQYVRQGQHVARSGSTGISTGPHLHFEINRWGKHKNPLRYLRR